MRCLFSTVSVFAPSRDITHVACSIFWEGETVRKLIHLSSLVVRDRWSAWRLRIVQFLPQQIFRQATHSMYGTRRTWNPGERCQYQQQLELCNNIRHTDSLSLLSVLFLYPSLSFFLSLSPSSSLLLPRPIHSIFNFLSVLGLTTRNPRKYSSCSGQARRLRGERKEGPEMLTLGRVTGEWKPWGCKTEW